MKRFASSAILSALAFASVAVEPLYIKHDYIKGSMPIMTNVETFVNGSIEIARKELQAEIDNIATNPASIASNIIEVAVKTSTNYTDKVIADGDFATRTELPTKTSQLANDGDGLKPFLTEHQSLADYPTKEELNTATNDLAIGLVASVTSVAESSTNYTDNATNEVFQQISSAVSDVATQATNYTDLATSNLATTDSVVAVAENLSTNYYTKSETDDAIDTLAAYYITSNANGDAFPTLLALTNATAYYSGGSVRMPTRNDYAVVLADEAHGGSEWRYIYTMAEGSASGQWEAQYPIETNDYEGLGNKPQINGTELVGNKTAAQLGLTTPTDIVTATNGLASTDFVEMSNASVALSATNYTDKVGAAKQDALPYKTNAIPAEAVVGIDFTDNNAVLVATIQATSPAPGNYSIVSNAAMTAVQPADLPPLTNDIPKLISDQASLTIQTSTNYTDNATNSLQTSLVLAIASAATASSNYTDKATNGLISTTYIATNNPAFVEAVTNCPVVVAGDIDSPTNFGEYGTLGALLAALASAIIWLRSNKADKSEVASDMLEKLDSTSAAPEFQSTKKYSVGEYVTYQGGLYECSTAITVAGDWTGSANWTAKDMTTPDATLDLMSDGRLRLVSADGDVLWMQGYGMASASSVTISCDKVNFHAFTEAPAFDATAAYAVNDIVAYDGVVYVFTAAHAAGAWTGSDASVYAVALEMPTAPSGKVGDFVLDVDNTANASASVTAALTGAGTAFDVFTPEGVNLSTDILTFAGGEQCELYFTMTAFGTVAKPAWKVVKQVVEKQEFGS